MKLFADTYTLWSHTTSQGSPCPGQLPFNILMPSTFQHKGQNVPLPPSYNASYYTLPSLFVRAGYQLHFVISRLRHPKVGTVWPKTKQYVYPLIQAIFGDMNTHSCSILLPFSYVPRTRPHRPIIYSECFFSSIKSTPEEWYQSVSYLKRYSSDATTDLTPPLSANVSPNLAHSFRSKNLIILKRSCLSLPAGYTAWETRSRFMSRFPVPSMRSGSCSPAPCLIASCLRIRTTLSKRSPRSVLRR